MSVDPLILGGVEQDYAHYIRNGETAVLVRAETDADVQFAIDVVSLYTPMVIEVLKRAGAGTLGDPDLLQPRDHVSAVAEGGEHRIGIGADLRRRAA